MRKSSFFHPTFHHAYQKIVPLINLKTKKQKSYFALTLSFLTLSFFGLFAIRPTLMTAFSLFKSNSDLKQLSLDYENKINALIRAQTEYEQIRDDLKLAFAALPATSDFHKIAKTIEKYANRENISLNQIQIDKVPVSLISSSGVKNFGFSLIGKGNYTSLSAFISHLLNHQRIIRINSLEFTKEEGTESANLRLTLKGTAYYEP